MEAQRRRMLAQVWSDRSRTISRACAGCDVAVLDEPVRVLEEEAEEEGVALGGRVVRRVEELGVPLAEVARGPAEVLRVPGLVEEHGVVVSAADGRDQQAHVVGRVDAEAGRARVLEGARLGVNVYVPLPLDAYAQTTHAVRIGRHQLLRGEERVQARRSLEVKLVRVL